MLPLVLLMCQMWLKVNTIAIQLNMNALEVTHVTKPVSSRAEASFEPSAFSFRFLVFWALVIGGLIPIVDIVCYTWEQLRMVAFSSKMNLKTSWKFRFKYLVVWKTFPRKLLKSQKQIILKFVTWKVCDCWPRFQALRQDDRISSSYKIENEPDLLEIVLLQNKRYKRL